MAYDPEKQELRFQEKSQPNEKVLFTFVKVENREGTHMANVIISNPKGNELVVTVSNPPEAENTKLVVKLDNPDKV